MTHLKNIKNKMFIEVFLKIYLLLCKFKKILYVFKTIFSSICISVYCI